MKGWTCEEWMDWMETDSAFALYNLKWPRNTPGKALFQKMWILLRGFVLHYMRPRKGNDSNETIERVRLWGQKYASLPEEVCVSQPNQQAIHFTPDMYKCTGNYH